MTREQSRLYVKNHLEYYLTNRGVNIRKPFRCLNPSHDDIHPSMSYDRNRKKAHCFACGADYDTFDIIGIDYNLHENSKIFKKAYELFGIDTAESEISRYISKAHQRASQTEYFRQRGLSEDTINRFRLGYDESYNRGTGNYTWKAVIIPTGENSFTARNINPKADKLNRIRKQGGCPIFNFDNAVADLADKPGPLFVVEGEFDAMSVIEAGGNAVALGSTANWRKMEFLFKGIIKGLTGIIVALDNDEDGKMTSSLLLEELKKDFGNCAAINISLEYKDPNEALVRDREAFIAAVSEASAEFHGEFHGFTGKTDGEREREEDNEEGAYLRTSAAFCLDGFKRGGPETFMNISTGFPALDNALGGFFHGLYIIGAISSLGKTTFVLQMADNIAAQGRDVLFFSLEMSKKELISKSLSRHTLINCLKAPEGTKNARTSLEIMCGMLPPDVFDIYVEYAKNIYISENSESAMDIRKSVERHISLTGRKPVVFIDYIQILSGFEFRGTDKQQMDRNVTELKRISRDFQIPVVGISSFNRQSYRESVTMEAFKESGAIEYSSDVLIGLQFAGVGKKEFDVDAEKRRNPRAIELKVLKNRNGKTGSVVSYKYYPKYNFFEEL